MSELILDTNIVSAFFKKEAVVLEALENATVYIPAIVIGELYYGAFSSDKAISYIMKILELERLTQTLDCDKETGKLYGEIRTKLVKSGKLIPENDMWIAALALQYQLPLVTRDKHFNYVDRLNVISW